MGTGLDASTNDPGVVPRAAADIFTAMNALKAKFPEAEFEVRVAFLELYNEELIDLLSNQRRDPKHAPQIREDGKGGIMWTNVENVVVETPEELLAALRKGSMCRTVGSTDMNLTSSRSHAIFSVTLTQRRPVQLDDMGQAISLKDTLMNENIGKTTENNEVKPKNESENAETPEGEATGAEKPTAPEIEVRTLVSKFHFVDLAGSERLKRTNATGDRAKEGISINAGLLALGNVISALADASSLKPGQPAPHIPYRDSKLTRLLQDSLGGNSQTLMLACVSASDSNFSETLSTLRYASRARKIQNRIRANVDDATASAAEVARLRAQVARLQNQLSELRKANLSSTNEPSPMEIERRKWLEHEVYRARFDASRLKERIQELEQEVIRTRAERDTLIFQYGEAGEEIDMDSDDAVHPLILKYIREIGELEHQLKEANRELRYYKEKDESTELEMESLDGFSLGSQTPSTPSSRAISRADRLSLFEVDLEKVIQDAEENQFSLTDSSSVTGDHMVSNSMAVLQTWII
jgi:polyhydroxyalkanoate synthesis regulator phasin